MSDLHKIAIVSGKGGVGKTTTTLNLGLALYNLGANIVLLDGNISTPNLGLYLDILKTSKTLNDVLKGKAKVHEAIHQHNSGLRLITSDLAVDAIKDINFNKINKVLFDLDEHANLVLVDTAATLGKETLNIIKVVDEVIIVTNNDKGALADALKTIGTCERLKVPVIGVIVNKARKNLNKKKIEDFLGVPIIGVIKHDKRFVSSTKNGKIYLQVYNTNNTDMFYSVAEKFLGSSYVNNLKRRKNTLFNYMLKQLGLSK